MDFGEAGFYLLVSLVTAGLVGGLALFMIKFSFSVLGVLN